MTFISVRDLRLTSGEVWIRAKEKKWMVLIPNGRPAAILNGVDENSLEQELNAM